MKPSSIHQTRHSLEKAGDPSTHNWTPLCLPLQMEAEAWGLEVERSWEI